MRGLLVIERAARRVSKEVCMESVQTEYDPLILRVCFLHILVYMCIYVFHKGIFADVHFFFDLYF